MPNFLSAVVNLPVFTVTKYSKMLSNRPQPLEALHTYNFSQTCYITKTKAMPAELLNYQDIGGSTVLKCPTVLRI